MGNKPTRQQNLEDSAISPLLSDLEDPRVTTGGVGVEENVFIRIWKRLGESLSNSVRKLTDFLTWVVRKLIGFFWKLIDLFRVVLAWPRGGGDQVVLTEEEERDRARQEEKRDIDRARQEEKRERARQEEERDREYREGILKNAPGFRFNVSQLSDLEPIAKLVKEKAELVKDVESIYKSGRDFRHNIILSLVGTILVGILNSIVDGLLADHISLAMRMIVLAIFNVAFMLYLGGATYEMHSIYEPSLTEAVSSHSLIIRSMNINRKALAVKESVPKKEGLSGEDERQLEYMLDDYCEKIIKPLPIYQQRKTSFTMVGCVVLSVVFAFVLKTLLLYGYPAPSSAPSPSPYG